MNKISQILIIYIKIFKISNLKKKHKQIYSFKFKSKINKLIN